MFGARETGRRKTGAGQLRLHEPKRLGRFWLSLLADTLRFDRLANGDLLRLCGFRHLALEVDGKNAVGQIRAGDGHVVSQLEATLEAARGDAAIGRCQVKPQLTQREKIA